MQSQQRRGDKATATGDANGEPSGDGDRLPTDEVYQILSNGRRRAALDEIDGEEPLSMGSLLDALAVREAGPDYERQEWKRVQVSWLQVHEPRLLEADAIRRTDAGYRLGPAAPRLLELLPTSEARGGVRSWIQATLPRV